MKLRNYIAFGVLASALGCSVVGCTSTPTQESSGQYVDSSAATTKVKAALLATKGIDSTDISVDTYKGIVQLSGFVNTQAQKTLAGQTAANVKGVKKVVNNLVVKTNS